MYDIRFRRKILSLQQERGLTNEAIASHFGIGSATVVRWRKRIEPCTSRNKPASKINMNNRY